MPIALLGFRFAASSLRRTPFRLLLQIVGACVATVLVLMLLGVPVALDRRAGREGDRTPQMGSTSEAEHGTRYLAVADRWRGQVVHRLVVSAVGDAAIPPGLDRLPDPGTTIVSPALHDLIQDEPQLSARFPGVIGETISPDGLRTPGELFAYVGAEPPAFGRATEIAVSFGATTGGAEEPVTAGVRAQVILGVVAFALVPLLLLVAVSARLGARRREPNLRALHALGVPPWALAVAVAVESAIVSALGALVATGLAAQLRGSATVGRAARDFVLASDVSPGAPATAIACLGVVCLAVLAGSLATRRVIGRTSVRPRWAPERPGPFPVILLAAGATATGVAATGLLGSGTAQTVPWRTLQGGVAMIALGLAGGAPWLVQRAARATAPLLAASVPTTLAGRRLEAEPRTVARMAGVLSAVAFLGGFAVLAAGRFSADEREAALRELQAGGSRQIVQVESLVGAPLPIAAIEASAEATLLPWVELEGADGQPVAEALVASCAELALLDAAAVPDCDELPRQLWLDGEPRPTPPTGTALKLRPPLRLTVPAATNLDGIVRVASVSSSAAPPSVATAVLPPDGDAVDALRTAVARTAPTAHVQVPLEADVEGAQAYEGNGRLFLMGAAVLFAFGLTAFALVTVDGVLRRRTLLSSLAALGTPARVLRISTGIEAFAPLLLGAVLASGAAAAAVSAYFRVVGDGAAVARPLLGGLLAGIAVVVALSVALTFVVPASSNIDDLRRE